MRIAALGALALLVLSFFEWFGAEIAGNGVSVAGSGVGGTAWQSTGALAVVLVAVIAVTLLVAARRELGRSAKGAAVPGEAVVAVLGGLATLAILFRVLVPPDGELGGVGVNAVPQAAVFLALAAAGAIAYGGYSAMRASGVGFGDVAERLERRRDDETSQAASKPPRRSGSRPGPRRRSRSSSG